ncbi:hypothetical protein RclHR1_00550029 [Rhizophagus clarus]|uniref:Uncharacterized protein n=1 Tax=Rhizophagus clarus TaxID=94130 RepID=A0A2Z6RNN6_9GLOM|nr:hypothetical protein RclHR1_00550029 [Rhizophagus clarus]GES80220.1 hypothetical protein GLOIN_2v1762116 [Rhizophagus clarus]
MKFHPLFISIIVSLIAFVSLIEGHTINVENKLVRGTWGLGAATDYLGSGNFDWDHDNSAIDQNWSIAHNGFDLTIPDDQNITTFYLVFGVSGSTEQDKWRGPFDNNQDYCWHFHGHIDSWKVYPCGSQ